MQDGIKDKLKGWLFPIPKECLPVQAVAYGLAFKSKVQNAPWNDQDAKDKMQILIDSVCDQLFLCELTHSSNNGHERAAQKRYKKIYNTFSEDGKNNNEISKIDLTDFNDLSSPKNRWFLKRAQRLSKGLNPTFKDFIEKINGVSVMLRPPESVINGIKSCVGGMISGFHEVNCPEFMEGLIDEINLDDGPKTTQELQMCLLSYIYSKLIHRNGIHGTEEEKIQLLNHPDVASVMELSTHLNTMNNDLGHKKINEFITVYLEAADDVSDTHFISKAMVTSLVHFYLEHNKEKLNASNSNKISDILDQLMHESFVNGNNIGGLPEENIEITLNERIKKMFRGFEKPSANKIMNELNLSSNNKKTEKALCQLESLREQIPTGMEEVTLYHYKENLYTSKIRQNSFKANKTYNGLDGPKIAFIKDIAHSHISHLLALDFSKDDVAHMRKTGKLPENCGYNIEHIIDREHGGTNHDYNFILMPEEINSLKDRLKQIQKRLVPNFDDGCWMLSWTPKKNDDGTFPKVYMGDVPYINMVFESAFPNDLTYGRVENAVPNWWLE